ncbi:MAG: helix-turn-helix domain-containing protein, partial [Steroidobacteraceae bacterium]
MASEAGGDVRCGIGTRLRGARENKGLTVLQAAERLRVDARVLDLLEAEDFAALGAAVYARGHLRRYAELVGESPAQLQELYSAAALPSVPDLTRVPRLETNGDPARLVMPALVVLIGFALAGVLWWLLTLPAPKPQPLAAGPA